MNLIQRIANGLHEVNLYFQQLQQDEQTRLVGEQHNENHQQFMDQQHLDQTAHLNDHNHILHDHAITTHLHDQVHHQTTHDHSTDFHNMDGGMGF